MRYFVINNIPVAQEGAPSPMFYAENSWQEISEAEYLAMLNPEPIQPDPLAVAKQSKLSELHQYVASFYANGFYDATTNYLLFTTEKDVMNYATLKNAIFDLADNTPVEIGTMFGWMTSAKATIYPLLVRYSQYMLPFTTKVMKATTMIQYAQTVAEVEAITW